MNRTYFNMSLQIIARVSIDNRTRALAQALRRTTDPRLCINRVEELTFHLLEFPEGKGVAVKVILITFNLVFSWNKSTSTPSEMGKETPFIFLFKHFCGFIMCVVFYILSNYPFIL